MWGLDATGLRVLDDRDVESFEAVGAVTRHPASFRFDELFLAAFPKVRGKDMSRTQLRKLASSQALRFGPFTLTQEDLEVSESTNQGFCVVSIGRKNRALIVFDHTQPVS